MNITMIQSTVSNAALENPSQLSTTVTEQPLVNHAVRPLYSYYTSTVSLSPLTETGRSGGYGYGSGYGLSTDPVTILSLLTLGALVIQSLLSLTTASSANKRSSQDGPLEWIALFDDWIPNSIVNYARSIDKESLSGLRTVSGSLWSFRALNGIQEPHNIKSDCMRRIMCECSLCISRDKTLLRSLSENILNIKLWKYFFKPFTKSVKYASPLLQNDIVDSEGALVIQSLLSLTTASSANKRSSQDGPLEWIALFDDWIPNSIVNYARSIDKESLSGLRTVSGSLWSFRALNGIQEPHNIKSDCMRRIMCECSLCISRDKTLLRSLSENILLSAATAYGDINASAYLDTIRGMTKNYQPNDVEAFCKRTAPLCLQSTYNTSRRSKFNFEQIFAFLGF
ncbi:uncharacterized protein LOC136044002 [Artemia franciscana]|uniref:uncharacterized protein LOC136044002 n=1 Tax=Artemia franciscana TaxID=6661 RepID=UPI0032DA97B7